MKLAKSELKEMIREALREELSLRENTNQSNLITKNIMNALDKSKVAANRGKAHNILVTASTAGRGIIATCHKWARENSVNIYVVDCRAMENLEAELKNFKSKAVIILDNYNRAHPKDRAQLLRLIVERTHGQLFTVAITAPNSAPLTDAEVYRFNTVISA